MTNLPENNDLSGKDNFQTPDYRAARRNLLKLGVAGMPMVLTLKASARSVAISQLQCVIVLPRRMRILVDSDGNAWAGTRNVRYQGNKGGYVIADIVAFKEHSNTIEFTGGVPSGYLPTPCSSYSSGNGNDDCSSDDDDDYDYDYDEFDSASSDLEMLMNASVISYADGIAGGFSSKSKDDDDDDDDDCEEATHIDCGYNFITLNKNTSIRPADYLSGNVWNLHGNEGLFVALSLQYACGIGTAGWPGISCIVSILTYVQQNGGSGSCPPY